MWKRLSMLWSMIRGDARLLWFALQHPLAPRWLKPALLLIGMYVLLPFDLLTDFIPGLGLVDDLVLVPLAMAFLVRRLPDTVCSDYARRAG
jgi:uncharacterized membrane protein YkvA (DUF1232 family)